MAKQHPLQRIVQAQKRGIPTGVYSICSAHKYVIRAGLKQAIKEQTLLVIEATSNQVNQFGGYTGMLPSQFRTFVAGLADDPLFSQDKLVLGGDHLGPNPWKSEQADQAMDKARTLVRQYALAGFTKLHLDASMLLGGDKAVRGGILSPEIVAERSAILCQAAEEGYKQRLEADSNAVAPVYVIGTEVPVPGGTEHDEIIKVTTVEDLRETIELSKHAFLSCGLSSAWQRVVAVVIQPGVEFSDSTVHEYEREKAQSITQALCDYDTLIFEGHSTDYQRPQSLRHMVEDGVAILKVGPALTYAMREAIFLLCHIEQELFANNHDFEPSHVIDVLDYAMLDDKRYWERYYRGSVHEQRFSRKYSLSDRSRYYWTNPQVDIAMEKMVSNLRTVGVPLVLLSQFMPNQYKKVRQRRLGTDPEDLIVDRICDVLEDYHDAVATN